ncbi:MAG: S49 family peptidase [Pseudomonadota bacterium]|nr:S49 family peptidase [Pseudomonadota bacterium]
MFSKKRKAKPFHVNMLYMHGKIQMGKQNINIGNYRTLIENAFTRGNPQLVILDLTTPGGSPTQSDLVYQELMHWKKKTGIPLYIVVQDVCASGGIWIAMAADKVFANRVSTIGSIGVIVAIPSFVELMKKAGVEMNIYAAGKNKAGINPMKPVTPEQEAEMTQKLNTLHKIFKEHVTEGRGETLKLLTPDLFEGTVWLGEEAHGIGLIDGLGYTREAIASHPDFKEDMEPKIKRYALRAPGIMGRFMGKSLIEAIVDALYHRIKSEGDDGPFKLH